MAVGRVTVQVEYGGRNKQTKKTEFENGLDLSWAGGKFWGKKIPYTLKLFEKLPNSPFLSPLCLLFWFHDPDYCLHSINSQNKIGDLQL